MSRTRLLGLATVVYALAAYAAFLAATAWTVTFLADLQLPHGIDHGERHSAAFAVVIDLALLLFFGVQHTVMARAGFKRWLSRWATPPVERSTYVLATSLVLLLLFWQWQPVGSPIWDVHHVAAGAIWAACTLGWLVAISSTYMVDHFDFLGLSKAYRYARGGPAAAAPFREWWLYAWVRHPMMLGMVLAFWATPRMTASHLLFAAGATGYIAVGVHFEERDLERELGEVYRDYADRVPAFLPVRRPTGPTAVR
jgi:protein-S-isoprenylcysteine O-methyltransferase Ste14